MAPCPARPSPPSIARSASSPQRPGRCRPPPAIGFLVVIGAAALFGMLGPLSRFAYDAGMQPAAFVAWRAGIALVVLAGRGHRLAASRRRSTWLRVPGACRAAQQVTPARRGAHGLHPQPVHVLRVRPDHRRPGAARLLHLPGDDRRGQRGARARAARPARASSPCVLALAGMAAVVASQLDPAAGHPPRRSSASGWRSGRRVSQTVYVMVSRDGYPDVPTEQAIAIVVARDRWSGRP